MAEIVPVVSETLEAKVRQTLPSQRGFGQDLQASNVIVPIIDLTAAAEGSETPTFLQTAIAFGSQTAFDATGTTVVIANTPGFYRIFGVATVTNQTSGERTGSFSMSDGLSTKVVWSFEIGNAQGSSFAAIPFDFTVFLASGESISAVSDSSATDIKGSSRQVADANGNLVNPSGFIPQ